MRLAAILAVAAVALGSAFVAGRATRGETAPTVAKPGPPPTFALPALDVRDATVRLTALARGAAVPNLRPAPKPPRPRGRGGSGSAPAPTPRPTPSTPTPSSPAPAPQPAPAPSPSPRPAPKPAPSGDQPVGGGGTG